VNVYIAHYHFEEIFSAQILACQITVFCVEKFGSKNWGQNPPPCGNLWAKLNFWAHISQKHAAVCEKKWNFLPLPTFSVILTYKATTAASDYTRRQREADVGMPYDAFSSDSNTFPTIFFYYNLLNRILLTNSFCSRKIKKITTISNVLQQFLYVYYTVKTHSVQKVKQDSEFSASLTSL